MNEISKLIEAYKRLRKNIDVMHQDIKDILEDFDMEQFDDDELDENIIYSIYFKEKMVIYIIIDLSAEIPFLQIFKYNVLDTKKDITKEYLKGNGYKGFDPNEDFNDEANIRENINKDFALMKKAKKECECISSPKINILSINSTDTVNSEIKELLSNMKDNKYMLSPLKEISIIE